MLQFAVIRRYNRYTFLLFIFLSFSCKKDSRLELAPPPDQSASKFAKELYLQWTNYAAEHPDQVWLASDEELDWKKIVLRISSDADRSINYYVPVLSANRPCTKALELSYGSEKNTFQATIRVYRAPIAKDGSSSESRRVQTILFNFSSMGLNVPEDVVNKEVKIQEQVKLKKTDFLNKKLASSDSNDRSGSSIVQGTRNCETLITFDFYYSFYGYTWNEYYVNVYNVQIANYFRSEVLSYLSYGLNLDYEMTSYGSQNMLTFYDMTDSDLISNAIQMALIHAAGTTQNFYSLAYSAVGYYYFDVNYSTCGNIGGGGGPSGPDYPDDPDTEPTVTITQVEPSNSKRIAFELSQDTWGQYSRESIDITIGASLSQSGWTAVLLNVNGNYSVQTKLIPGVQEVSYTDHSNYCAQVRDLKALSYNDQGQWYMIAAIIAHENVHVSRAHPALQTALPFIKASLQNLTLPYTGQSKAEAILQLRTMAQFENAKNNAFISWRDASIVYVTADHAYPSGAAYLAERSIVAPVGTSICNLASSKTPPWPTCNYCPF